MHVERAVPYPACMRVPCRDAVRHPRCRDARSEGVEHASYLPTLVVGFVGFLVLLPLLVLVPQR
jgi:hypothetical protein